MLNRKETIIKEKILSIISLVTIFVPLTMLFVYKPTAANATAIAIGYGVLPKALMWLLPTPLSLFWSSSKLYSRGLNLDLTILQKLNLIPDDIEIVLILSIIGIISIILIDFIYRKRSEY